MAKRVRTTPARAPSVAVIVSRYNEAITFALRDAAVATYRARFGSKGGPVVVEAAGAFELPALAQAAAESGRFAAVVCLGCVVKGETSHDRYISQAVADAIVSIPMMTGVPVAFGVLTVDTVEQARDRAGGRHGNKGEEAMVAALETLAGMTALRKGKGYVMGVTPNDKTKAKST